MLKKSLPLLGLFLLLFIGTFVLLGGDLDLPWMESNRTDAGDFQDALKTGAQRDAESRNRESGAANDPGSASGTSESEAGDGLDAPGKLQGRVVDDQGRPIPKISMRLNPGAGTLVRDTGADWLIEDVPAGSYQLEVWAEGFVPARVAEVTVRAGRRSWQDIQLDTGIQPAGRVIDETDLSGVANALIHFSGRGLTRSAADGSFRAPYVIPQSAMAQITVSHPEYDRFTHIRMPIQDSKNMTLALSRGTATITGRLISDLESARERTARLRLFFATGGRHDLRREQRTKAIGPFEFRRVHQGLYNIVVDFPNTNLPEVHREVLIKIGETKDVEIRIGEGATVTGTLKTIGPPANGTRVEIIDGKGLTIAGCRAGPDGAFRMTSVPAGTYRVKVYYANPWFNTRAFDVSGRGTIHLEIDCARRRLKR